MTAAPLGRLAADIALVVDDGEQGRRPTAHGIAPVERALAEVLGALPDATVRTAEVNGTPGWTIQAEGRVVGVICAERRGPIISRLWIVLDHEKLRSWNSG